MQKKFLTKEQALQKLRHYCAYQERSQHEVVQKLWELGVRKADHDDLVATMIEEDYLNEERFAVQFAGGKFRLKEWGRKKIYYGLKEKGVSNYNITKALSSIDEDDYRKTLHKLAEKKYELLSDEDALSRKRKTVDYLIQKGYEHELVSEVLKELTAK